MAPDAPPLGSSWLPLAWWRLLKCRKSLRPLCCRARISPRERCVRGYAHRHQTRVTEILDRDPLRVVLADRNEQLTDSPVGYEHFVRTDGESSLFPTNIFYLRPLRRSINGFRVGESSLLCIQDDPALAESYDLRNGGRKRSWSRPSATPTGRFNWSSTGERNGGVGLRPIRRR